MKLNNEMQRLLVSSPVTRELTPELVSIAERGFQVVGDCYLLASLLEREINVGRRDFQDATGYECFINSLHIEDYDETFPLPQAIQFIHCIFQVWNKFTSLVLVAALSADELCVVVKFHVKRDGESWLSADLKGYIDATMLMNSTEDVKGAISSVAGPSKSKK